jgi:hypothetical protein
MQLDVRCLHALNRTQINGPELNPTSGKLGRIISAPNLPRAVQLALRLRWYSATCAAAHAAPAGIE